MRLAWAYPIALSRRCRPSGSDIVVRGTFNVQDASGVGTSTIVLSADLAPSDHRISASIGFTSTGSLTTASLVFTEGHFLSPMPTTVASDALALPAAAVAELLAGGDFVVELNFDAATQTTVAWLSINGNVYKTNPIALVAPVGQTLFDFVASVGTAPTGVGPTTFTAETEDIQLEVDAALFEPFLNLDVGSAQGVPVSTFAGAGFAGSWNGLGLGGPQPLVDTGNNPTPATATVIATNVAGSTPGAGPLKGDHLSNCSLFSSNWRVDFANLQDGAYRVLVYAPADGTPTHDMDVEGTAVLSLPGEPGTTLTEGVSWDWALATAEGGNLTIEEIPNGTCDAGLAGIQVESVPEPNIALLLLAGTLGLALQVHRKRHDCD